MLDILISGLATSAKGGTAMNNDYEQEWTPDTPQEDSIYVLDGRGQMIRVEVADDADDD